MCSLLLKDKYHINIMIIILRNKIVIVQTFMYCPMTLRGVFAEISLKE